MVDIHCHILPCVDDGAKSWDIAVEMCRMAEQDGIDHIVATPHANDEFTYDRAAHEATLQQLRERINGSLQLSLGCDFHFSYENVQRALQQPELYCIGSSRYLLVEFSDFALPPNTADLLLEFVSRGVTPIITHPERNPILQRKLDMLLEWTEDGVLVQVTANSLTGRWGPQARKVVEALLKRGAVHVIATDAHSLNSRPPIMSEAREVIAKLAGREVAEALVETNPRAIVTGHLLS